MDLRHASTGGLTPATHSRRQQRELQYEKYINRYGPGAIIYWYGFVEEIAATEHDLLLLSSFPMDIVQLRRLPVRQNVAVTT
jgi:hypothetical protein